MGLRNLWALALGALVLIGPTANAAGQTPFGTLNRLEVQRLAMSTNVNDQRRLATHFAAVADQYTAIARRHVAKSHALAGHPNHQVGDGGHAHFKRLAEINTQWAATARELAAHHERLAARTDSVPPRDAPLFEAGAGAPEPSEEDLSALAARARTPADHRELATAYAARAGRYSAEVNEHVAMAATYRGTKIAMAAVHCDRIVMQARQAAANATAAATTQRELAGTSK